MRTSKSDRLSDPEAHARLKQLYNELIPEGMTQERFGATYGIGTQGMVWQFLNGHTPLTVEAAAKFAKGLGCTIYDISPMLDASLKSEIIPFMGPRKKLRRAAVLAFLAFTTLLLPPPPAGATPLLHNRLSLYTLSAFRRWLVRWFAMFQTEQFIRG